MPGPSVMVRILADLSKFGQTVKDAGTTAESAAARMHTAFSATLGALNQTGILGPFGAALDGVDTALDQISKHGKDVGLAMIGVGGAMAGVGAGLTALGSKDQAAHQQLQAAVAATGQSYDDYGAQVDAAVKHQERFGDTAGQTQDALARLTEATHDPAKALDLLSVATDLAAAKHEDLGTAATAVGKIADGNTKLLKAYGIEINKTTGLTVDGKTATQALADVLKGQASAAADTFMGKLDAMKTRLEDQAAAMGQKYGPAVTAVGSLLAGLGAAWEVISAIMAADWFVAFWPVGLVVLAIAGIGVAIYLMWDKIKEAFHWIIQNWPILAGVLTGPFGLAAALIWKFFGQDIKQWVKDAVDFIIGVWNGLVGFFTGLPDRMAGIFKGMWNGIADAFADAINFILHIWNDLHFKAPGFSVFGHEVGGFDIGLPHIDDVPHLAQGGLITQTGLIYAHAGEAITPAGKTPGAALVINNATFNSAVDVDMLSKRLEFAINAGVHP
jgi:hypothetical protein